MSGKSNKTLVAKEATKETTEQAPSAEQVPSDEQAPSDEQVPSAEQAPSDDWDLARSVARAIFEQYKDKNDVFVTFDGNGFWTEDLAASHSSKYKQFKRSLA